MPYTTRQMHCMQVMGLVPWVSRKQTLVPGPVQSAAVGGELPASVGELAAWLPDQQLAIVQHSTQAMHPGSQDARILAIFDNPGQSAAGLPLANGDFELFDAMLQAIGLARRDVCLCALTAVAGSPATAFSLLDLPQWRAVLLFITDLDSAEDEHLHRFAASTHGTPGWRLPHPALLQREPLRKRQAWNVLKAVRAAVADS